MMLTSTSCSQKKDATLSLWSMEGRPLCPLSLAWTKRLTHTSLGCKTLQGRARESIWRCTVDRTVPYLGYEKALIDFRGRR